MNSKAFWKNAALYIDLLVLFSLVAAYQLKSSLETVHTQRTLKFFVPFTFQPFTNRIDRMAYVHNWDEATGPELKPHSILHAGDEILSVAGHPFRGLSLYLRTLVYDRSVLPMPWHGFTVTARLADSTVRHVEFGFPNCTCGVPQLWEAVSVWVVPPAFCVMLGFTMVLCRPRAALAWGFLAALLALSQLQSWEDVYPGFWSVTTTPMAWDNWFRLFGVGYRPFVQSLWPAALLVASTHFYWHHRRATRLALGLSVLFLIHAMLSAALQIAWSENYRPFVALYRLLDSHETDFVAWAFIAVVLLSWTLSRKLGMAAAGLALIAIIIMYSGPSPVTHGDWVDYVDGTRGMVFDIPTVHNTPALAITLFIGGMFGSALLIFRRRVTRVEARGFLLLLPILLDCVERSGAFWYPLYAGPFRYWYWVACAFAGIGLACLFWSILKRTDIEKAVPGPTLAS